MWCPPITLRCLQHWASGWLKPVLLLVSCRCSAQSRAARTPRRPAHRFNRCPDVGLLDSSLQAPAVPWNSVPVTASEVASAGSPLGSRLRNVHRADCAVHPVPSPPPTPVCRDSRLSVSSAPSSHLSPPPSHAYTSCARAWSIPYATCKLSLASDCSSGPIQGLGTGSTPT